MKLNIFYFLISFGCLSRVFCISFYNYNELMKQYYLLCGENYLCKERIEFRGRRISLKYKYVYSGLCPECKCDNACILRGDCCPDLYFSFPELSCVNRTIIQGTNDGNMARHFSDLMVSSCPDYTYRELQEKCTTLTDTKSRLINLPVTGNDLPLSFYNRYCAKCNGVTNYTSWALDIDCKITTDFNYMSSLNEIIDASFSNQCLFQAYRDASKSEAKEEYCFNNNENGGMISDCDRMSGRYTDLDYDIRKACRSSYKMRFRMFKNVFCYMCNPVKQNFQSQNRNTCNETGHWQNSDSELQYACKNLPTSLYTQPYKNVFCYLCNRGNDPKRSLLDVYGDITEAKLKVNEWSLPHNYNWYWPTNIDRNVRRYLMTSNDARWRYKYDLKIYAFDLAFFKQNLLNLILKENGLGKGRIEKFRVSSFRDNKYVKINMTNLLLQGLALNGEINVCNSRRQLLPVRNLQTCKCELSCIFNPDPTNCCLDLALEVPVSCFNIGKFTSDSEEFSYPRFLTLDGCLQETRYKIFEQECSTPKTDDIFSHVPLTKGKSLNYANLYCAICNLGSTGYVRKMNMKKPSNSNENESIPDIGEFLTEIFGNFSNMIESYDIWNLEIACYNRLDYLHILTASEFLQLSRRMRCRIRYKPKSHESELCRQFYHFVNCENPSEWSQTDKDVRWACQNAITLKAWISKLNNKFPEPYDEQNYRNTDRYRVYRNFYCALCKPDFNSSELIDPNCTDRRYEDQCLALPSVYYYYPFKNVYCARCSGIENNTHEMPGQTSQFGHSSKLGPPVAGVTWFPLIRNLFSISIPVTEIEETEETNSSIRCGANQVVDSYKEMCRNVTCYSGKYLNGNSCLPLLQITTNLRYSLRIQLGVYYTDSVTHVAYLPKSFKEFKDELDVYLNKKGISAEIMATTEQFKKMGASSNNVCWYIRVQIFVGSSVPRLYIENNLLEFKKTILNGCTKKRKTEKLTYKGLIYEVANHTRHTSRTSYVIISKFFLAKVSEVLLCRQIEISSDEYEIDNNTSELILLKDGSELSFDDYDIAPDGILRICLDRLEEMSYFDQRITIEMPLIQTDYQLYYLWIISLACSGTSLFSLLLSLVIYAAFPALHNTPGKLLMTTMASLFFTLLALQMSYFAVESRPACIAIAIVLHFSWLSVFTSMQASNFHMFRTFTSNDPQRHSSSRFFDKTFLKYLLYIFGLPLLFLLCNVLVAWFIHSDDDFGYGGRKCFINNNYRLLATFIIPIALMCIVNIIFLLCTIRAIHLTPNPQSSRQKRNELAIYIRLTSTTGISWLLQVIDSFLPLTPFSFVATSINSLQGFFIFIAFIINKRMITILRDKFSKMRADFTSTQTVTTGITDKTAMSRV